MGKAVSQTLILDIIKWDLLVDSAGNIAVASNPYSEAQDAASAIKTFQGEVYYNTLLGVPYWASILGQAPPVSLMKSNWVAAALTVPNVVAAVCFITSFINRKVSGQVQITDADGLKSTAGF